MTSRILLHVCCAPCSIKCVERLRTEGTEPVLFWYNPNIHPFTEYRNRKDALVRYAGEIGLELILRDEYGLRSFLARTGCGPDAFQRGYRCPKCYASRLEATAAHAEENGFDGFCTSLSISPYQDHALIREIGDEAARRFGVEFFYRDFRPWFREGQREARERGLYMQKYCGCLFSEEERFLGPREPLQPSGS